MEQTGWGRAVAGMADHSGCGELPGPQRSYMGQDEKGRHGVFWLGRQMT